MLEKFLMVTSQLEQLKVEWGLKVLNCHTINTKRLVKDLEAVYKERILRVAKKIVSKIQIRDMARKQAEEVREREVGVWREGEGRKEGGRERYTLSSL